MRQRIGLIRFLLEAAFVALVAAAVAFADLSWIWIAVVLGAWLLLVIVERSESRPQAVEAEAPEPEGHVEPEPEPEPEPKLEPVLVAVASPPEPPAPEPAAAGPPARAWRRRARDRRDESVVRLRLPQTPREWNIWELERLASATKGEDPAQDEERALLVMSLRQFADASGELPVDFDSLVREAFEPELLDGLAPSPA